MGTLLDGTARVGTAESGGCTIAPALEQLFAADATLKDPEFERLLQCFQPGDELLDHAAHAGNSFWRPLHDTLRWLSLNANDTGASVKTLVRVCSAIITAVIGVARMQQSSAEAHVEAARASEEVLSLTSQISTLSADYRDLTRRVEESKQQACAYEASLESLRSQVTAMATTVPHVIEAEVGICNVRYKELSVRLESCEQQLAAAATGPHSGPHTKAAVDDPRRVLLRRVSPGLADQLEAGGDNTLGLGTLGGKFERRWRSQGSDEWNVVWVVSASTRSAIMRAAVAIRAATGVVVAPYLTAFGRTLRKERMGVFGQLAERGLKPRWCGGAGIVHLSGSNWKPYDFAG